MAGKPKGFHEVEAYPYTNSEGSLLFEKVRYEDGRGNKDFRQRRPSFTGGWVWGLEGVSDKPLYRLPRVLEQAESGGVVYIVEGEKDVHSLEALGRTATTCFSTGAWSENNTKSLIGTRAVLVPDNDEPGWKHGWDVYQQLVRFHIPVRILSPFEYSDITDILRARGSLEEFLVELEPEQLRDMAGAEPPSRLEALVSDLAKVADDDKALRRVLHLVSEYSDEESGIHRSQGKLDLWENFILSDLDESYDWVIPGLLERQERVIVVAAEGVGKTMLSRQMAMLSSAGIHPFEFTPIPKMRTLTVDLENPERIIKRTSRRIYDQIMKDTDAPGLDQANLLVKPDGVNLLKLGDRVMLEEYIDSVQPDILFLGPLYKSFLDPGSGKTAEAVTSEVAHFFDYIRHVYNCAIWLEHHAPLGQGRERDLRPFGSSVWSRWSEFGIAMRVDDNDPDLITFNHYRGQREARPWPEVCRKGGRYPFTPAAPARGDDFDF